MLFFCKKCLAKLLLLIRTNDCSDSRVHSNIYRLLNCHFFSVGLLSLITPNILQQIRGTVHLVILNQGFLIELQYPRNEDHCQLHNVVPRKKGRTDFSNQSTSRPKYNVNPSLKPLLTYLSGTTNYFLRKDTSAKSLYLEQFHMVNAWVIVQTAHLNYPYFILTNPLIYLLNDMTVANFRNCCLDCSNSYFRPIQSAMIS